MNVYRQIRYLALRKKYPTMSARAAYREAHSEPRAPIAWDTDGNGDKSAALELDGFTVSLSVAYDYDHDWLDSRGKFSSTWQAGALKNPNSHYDRNVFEWFIPETNEEEHYRELV